MEDWKKDIIKLKKALSRQNEELHERMRIIKDKNDFRIVNTHFNSFKKDLQELWNVVSDREEA